MTPASVQVVALLGGECTGKTTLARDLHRELPATYVPEMLREFVDREGRTPAQHEQRAIMRAQIAAETTARARAAANGIAWVVSDPGALMTAVYSIAYFDDDSLVAEALAHQASYRLTVWCDPAFPWEADGEQRDGPEHRARVHELLAEVIEGNGLTVLEVAGSPDERLTQVKAALATS